MTPEMIALAARRMRALGEENRIRILLALRESQSSVGELAEALGASTAATSKHLQVLADAGIVARKRDGNRILYAIDDTTVFDICEIVCDGVHRHQRRVAEAIGLTRKRG